MDEHMLTLAKRPDDLRAGLGIQVPRTSWSAVGWRWGEVGVGKNFALLSE
jgi:hypothetical protein